MLTPFSRAVVYYLGGGFALALLCSLWLFDASGAPTSSERLTRRAFTFSVLGVLHPVIALAAWVLARDARAQEIGGRRPHLAALTSLAVSTAAMLGVLAATVEL